MWGKAGVNLFCLIMGYFGIRSEFKIKKAIQLEAQVIFYSLFGLCIALIFKSKLSFSAIVVTFFPIIFNQYWYITAYIMVYILSPFLNKALLELNEVQYRRLIAIMMTFWCIIPFFSLQENSGLFWNQFIWFIVMYDIGGYLRLNRKLFSERIYWAVLLISNIILILSVVGINWLSYYFPRLEGYTTYTRWSNCPLIICVCISMMRLVECRNTGYSKLINFLASGTLGIYLFHENVFIKDIIWNKLFNSFQYIGSYTIVLHIVMAIAFIYVMGSIIDMIRRFLFMKMETVFSFVSNRIEKKVERYEGQE